ncbi:MAG: septum formation initiator family protein [Ignavibacteriaceae bacterium]|nr:septum formation initiator family protein [Ignavibacteriaceae bacterium]
MGKPLLFFVSVSVIISLILLFLVLFSDSGQLKLLETEKEKSGLERDLKILQDENLRLKGEIDSLKAEINARIEKVARENHGMKRKDEKVIKIEEK